MNILKIKSSKKKIYLLSICKMKLIIIKRNLNSINSSLKIQNWCYKYQISPKAFKITDKIFIQKYVPHSEYKSKHFYDDIEKIGYTIANLHNCLNKYNKPLINYRVMNNIDFSIIRNDLIKYDNIISRKIINLQDKFSEYYDLKSTPKIKYQIIHGDMHPQNILSYKDKYYIIDFDNITYFPASYEVLRFYFELISDDLKNPHNLNILAKLIISYNKNYKLDTSEWENALYFYVSILLRDITMIENTDFINKRILRALFILNNLHEIEDTIIYSLQLEVDSSEV